MSSSLFADDVMRSAEASAVASKRTSFMAMHEGGVKWGLERSSGSARMTLENVPRPKERSFT